LSAKVRRRRVNARVHLIINVDAALIALQNIATLERMLFLVGGVAMGLALQPEQLILRGLESLI